MASGAFMIHKISLIICLFSLGVLVLFATSAFIVEKSPYNKDLATYLLSWSIDGGGTLVENDQYTLMAAIGQPDAKSRMASGKYQLSGGLFVPVPVERNIFLPVIVR